jgi:hypothetical protein
VSALTEEYAGRTVELRNDNAFSAVYNERTFVGHIRNRTEIDVLYFSRKILVIGIGTVKFEFGFEGDTIGKAAFQALRDRVSRRIDIVVEELEDEVVTSIGDREILGKNLIEAFVISFFRRSVEL